MPDSVAWERSQPGSGPTPKYPDPSSDKAIVNGWRYDSPPAAFEVPPQFEVPPDDRPFFEDPNS